MIKLLITIYAIYIHYNLYPNKTDIISILLIILFPAFFIAATAAINVNYLNPFYKQDISDYHYGDFLDDLRNLDNINVRFFTIFLPIYLSIQYVLYNDFIRENWNNRRLNKQKLLDYLISKKKHIQENKIYYLIIILIIRFKYFVTTRLFKAAFK